MWFSPSGDFDSPDVTKSPVLNTHTYQLDDALWDAHCATDWAAGVHWRVLGVPAASWSMFPTTQLFVDPDLDDDGWKASEDCDDSRPDVHPSQDEQLCYDGVDENCDGSLGCVLGTDLEDIEAHVRRTSDVTLESDIDADGDGVPPYDYFRSQQGLIASCDVNGDGIRDLVTSGHRVADGPGGEYIGEARVFYGPILEPVALADADAVITVVSGGSGPAGLTCGDLTGDGVDDVVVGDTATVRGAVRVRIPRCEHMRED